MSTINPNFGQFNHGPQSNQSIRNAQLTNAQTFVATVKGKEELETKEESAVDNDSVMLSDKAKTEEPTSEQKQTAAGHAGVMSDLQESKQKKSKDKIGKSQMFGGEAQIFEKKPQPKTEVKAEKADSSIEELSPQDKKELMEILNQRPEQIMGDIPAGFANAAKKMVEAKVKKGVAEPSLKQMKELPDTSLALVDFKPHKNVDIMPIHDTKDIPISIDMEEGAA